MTIVGIVDDVRHSGLEQNVRPEAFRSHIPGGRSMDPEACVTH